jgi:hypothetical protein
MWGKIASIIPSATPPATHVHGLRVLTVDDNYDDRLPRWQLNIAERVLVLLGNRNN